MLRLGTRADSGDLVIDFFGGSATTLQAVIDQNADDDGNRCCIVVQLPEPLDGGTETLNTIAEIGRVRVRKAIANLQGKADLATTPRDDLGLKSFVLAPSNFKQWRGDGIDTSEQLAEQMQMFAKSEKEGAQVEDMLYELLLRFGQELTTSVEPLEFALTPGPSGEATKVFAIHDRKMLFVLESFTEAMIVPLVDMKPREIIAIDGVFNNSDMLKTNLDLQCRDAGIRFTCL